jgi:hypothetical protein
MTTIDLKYLLVIGLPLLIILCVIMFMIGRQSGKKYVYRMMNGGQVYDYPISRVRPEDPVEAAKRQIRYEEELLKSRRYDSAKPRVAIQAETDPGRLNNRGGMFWWMGGTEGARG